MNLKLVLEYDGTDFCGWQVQPGQRTVQGVLEGALERLMGYPVRVHGSGRTDAGVHATGQVASVALETTIPPERLQHAINPMLPADVKVVSSQAVPQEFHARHSARGKTYAYHLLLRDVPAPLLRKRVWQVRSKLDLARIQESLKLVEGTHDFKAFCAAGHSVVTTERTIWQASLSCTNDYLVITLHGSGFLYNMVRIIVGAAVAVGRGSLSLDDVAQTLSTGHRHRLISTAPAHGLYLVSVDY